jgi:hypothetical protein
LPERPLEKLLDHLVGALQQRPRHLEAATGLSMTADAGLDSLQLRDFRLLDDLGEARNVGFELSRELGGRVADRLLAS